MGNSQSIDIRSDAFARRLANLLSDRREVTGRSIRELARASEKAFNGKFLRAVEDGRAELDEETVCELAALYGAELAEILPSRLPLRITEPATTSVGVISTSGITAEFDPHHADSLLTSYLLLVRQLRDQEREPIIDLRREDVETIAAYLHEPAPSVLERLMTLMGATRLQRRAMVGMFVAGAIVIGLAGSGVAAFTDTLDSDDGHSTPPPSIVTFLPGDAATNSPPDPTVIVTTGVEQAPSEQSTGAGSSVSRNGEPLGGAPGAHPPITAEVIDVVVPDTSVIDTVVVDTVPEPVVDPVVTEPATATTVATGTPPVDPGSTPEVGPPPVPTDPATTVDPVTIPDLPYDPPVTTEAPATTAAPPTTETAPPVTDAPPTTEQVATGPPPVPAP
jgi:hypothetical protein